MIGTNNGNNGKM